MPNMPMHLTKASLNRSMFSVVFEAIVFADFGSPYLGAGAIGELFQCADFDVAVVGDAFWVVALNGKGAATETAVLKRRFGVQVSRFGVLIHDFSIH